MLPNICGPGDVQGSWPRYPKPTAKMSKTHGQDVQSPRPRCPKLIVKISEAHGQDVQSSWPRCPKLTAKMSKAHGQDVRSSRAGCCPKLTNKMPKAHGPTKLGLRLILSPLYVTVGDTQSRLLHDRPISLPQLLPRHLARNSSPEHRSIFHRNVASNPLSYTVSKRR